MVKPISLNTLSSQKLTGLFKDPVQGDPPKEVKGGFTPAELKASFKSDVVYSIPVNEEWFNLENRRLATRRAIDPEAVQSMGESIKTHGQEQPVKCRWDETNRLQIILGETRTHACKLIGKEVLVLITDADERTCKAWALSENLQRNDMKGYDQALKMYELQKENFSVDEISIIANKKKALIYQTFKIFDYPKITEALEAGKITISDARLLASTTSSKSLEEGLQVKAIEALSAGTLKVSDLDYFADKKGDIPLATAPAAPGRPGAPTDPASKSDDSSKPKPRATPPRTTELTSRNLMTENRVQGNRRAREDTDGGTQEDETGRCRLLAPTTIWARDSGAWRPPPSSSTCLRSRLRI